MRISASASRLRRMLRGAGLNSQRPDAATVGTLLKVYEEFSAIPVLGLAKDDSDLLLAQYGTFTFTGNRLFSVDLTRQFMKSGEDSPMWQLSSTLAWTPTDVTDSLGLDNLWSSGLDLKEFFAEVRKLGGFNWALNEPRPPQSLVVLLQRI